MKTFLDAGVLLAAHRGEPELREKALSVIEADREFVTTDFVRLEVLPKAVYHKQENEIAFYNEFFDVAESVPVSQALVDAAFRVANEAGLAALDALHVSAATEADCVELVTTEQPTKPLFRVAGIAVTNLRDAA